MNQGLVREGRRKRKTVESHGTKTSHICVFIVLKSPFAHIITTSDEEEKEKRLSMKADLR